MSETLGFDPDALREKYRQERDRRLRPEANDQYVEITADFRHYIDDPHVDPGFTRKPLTHAGRRGDRRRRLRRPLGRGAPARVRGPRYPPHPEGRRLPRHLVL